MSILSTCYNTLGFGRWEELCHEFMASVLPMDDPRMSVDDLSSPTWRIIFLKDDCFLQPSCEVTSSDPDSATTHHHHYEDEVDNHTIPSSPSSMIEPLFDEIDLNHHHHQHQQNHQTQHINYTDQLDCTESIERFDGMNQLPSPTLSRSSSLSLSDVDDQVRNRSPQPRASPKIIQQQRKRKRQPQAEKNQKKNQNQKQQRTQKRYRHHDTTTTETTTLFDQLSLSGINWCRYCGTTEGVNWRPGPWGKRTLCNKHGCDYKGYGLASRLPRLDLSGYRHELVEDRHCPVIQEFCFICQQRGGGKGVHQHQRRYSHSQQQKRANNNNVGNADNADNADDNSNEDLVACDGGCSRAFHRHCYDIDDNSGGVWMDQRDNTPLWFCGPSCSENRRKKRVVVDLPRKQPLMRPLKKE